jgi:hypothetical protein
LSTQERPSVIVQVVVNSAGGFSTGLTNKYLTYIKRNNILR